MTALQEHRLRTPVDSVRPALAGGLSLGVLAVAADLLPDGSAVRAVATPVLSGGLSWGLGALAAGALARRAVRAALAGGLLLVVAVVAYYAAVLAFGLRTEAGGRAVLLAASVWLGLALVGGPILGLLGWVARHGAPNPSAAAVGVLAGALMSQGLSYAVSEPDLVLQWPPSSNAVVVWLVTVVPLAAAVAWGTRLRRVGVALGSCLVAAAVGAAAWSVATSVLRPPV